MKVISIILFIITQITITLHTNAYDFWNLNWKGAKKNMCSSNIQKAIGLNFSPGNAKDWIKHTDKTNEDYIPILWDIAVIDKHNYTLVFAGDLRNLKKPKKARKRKSRVVKHHRKSKDTSTMASEPKYFEPPIRTEDDGPDVKTIIELQDLVNIFINYKIAYKGVISSAKILTDAISYLQAHGIAFAQIDTPNEFMYSNGFSFTGRAIDLIHNICARGGCRCCTQNRTIHIIRNGGKNLDYMFELNSSNCPAPEEDTNLEINVDAPIDIITINPDNYVSLDFRTVKGIKKVYKVEAKIDNYGGGSQGVKLVCKSK